MKEMKSAVITENMRLSAVITALKFLKETSDLYKDVSIVYNWDNNEEHDKVNSKDDKGVSDDSDGISKDGDKEYLPGQSLLDQEQPYRDEVVSIAPGQRPLGLLNDPDAEYLAFPT